MAKLERIWIKRTDKSPRMDPRDRATMVTDYGLEGNADHGGKRQITILSAERWAEAVRGLAADLDPVLRHANLLVSDIDLEDSCGRTLRVGNCRIEILGETKPCSFMDQQHAGLLDALKPHWGGGCYGKALDDGDIHAGDAVAWE